MYTVQLLPSSSEYQDVLRKMQATVGAVHVQKIERVQNPHLYQSYMVRKQKIDKDNGGNSERQLFHGTDGKNISHINAQGFNRSFCGAHGESLSIKNCLVQNLGRGHLFVTFFYRRSIYLRFVFVQKVKENRTALMLRLEHILMLILESEHTFQSQLSTNHPLKSDPNINHFLMPVRTSRRFQILQQLCWVTAPPSSRLLLFEVFLIQLRRLYEYMNRWFLNL